MGRHLHPHFPSKRHNASGNSLADARHKRLVVNIQGATQELIPKPSIQVIAESIYVLPMHEATNFQGYDLQKRLTNNFKLSASTRP